MTAFMIYKINFMKKHINFDANEYLKALIPHLDEFSFLCGTEGKVYFVDDNFVVKTYFEPFNKLSVFNEFCKEINNSKSVNDMKNIINNYKQHNKYFTN